MSSFLGYYFLINQMLVYYNIIFLLIYSRKKIYNNSSYLIRIVALPLRN